jgi:hypothetical protein
VTLSNPSLLTGLTARDVATDPFPHLVIESALPAARYGQLADRFPAVDAILRGRNVERSNSAARLPFFLAEGNDAVDPDWRAFLATHVSQDFWRDIVAVFGPTIRAHYPTVEARVGRPLETWRTAPRGEEVRIGPEVDVELDCQFVVNTPVREVSAVRTVHVDGEDTLFSGLYYLREPGDGVGGGDLELGRWRRRPRFLPGRMILPGDVEIAKTVRYDANLFACFVNGPRSIHGVTPRGVTPLFRRYINIIAKVGFNLFEAPEVGKAAWYLHARQIKGVNDRFLRGDRNADASPPRGAGASSPRGEGP